MSGLTILDFGGMWKTSGLWIRKAMEHYKLSWMCHPGWSIEDSSPESYADCRGLTQEISEGDNIYQHLGLQTFFWYFCHRMWVLFALVLRLFLRLKEKNNGLLLLTGEIFIILKITNHVVISIHSYAGLKWQDPVDQKEIQNVEFEEKKVHHSQGLPERDRRSRRGLIFI